MSKAFREWWQREAAGKGNDKALRNRKGMERAFNAGLLAAAEIAGRHTPGSKYLDDYELVVSECAGDIEDEIRQAAED